MTKKPMDYKELWDDISTNAYALGIDGTEKRIEDFINDRVKAKLEVLGKELVGEKRPIKKTADNNYYEILDNCNNEGHNAKREEIITTLEKWGIKI
jgi:hypothetical protein